MSAGRSESERTAQPEAATRQGVCRGIRDRSGTEGGRGRQRKPLRRGGGEKPAGGKLTAVVGLVAVGVRLVLGRFGGRPRRAGAGAGAGAGAIGSEELVDILVVVAGAVGGAAATRAGRGRARGGVWRCSGAEPGVRGQAPREAGEVVGDLLDGPDGAGAHVDGHMLLDADGRLLPAPPEGHAGSAAPPGRGPNRPGAAPARGRLSRPGGARLGLRALPAAPPDGPDAAAACSAAAGASECQGPAGRGRAQPASPAAAEQCECAGGAGGAERSEPSGAALTRTHTGAHAGPGPRARTLGGQGPGRLLLTHGGTGGSRAGTRWTHARTFPRVPALSGLRSLS